MDHRAYISVRSEAPSKNLGVKTTVVLNAKETIREALKPFR